jgi:flagellar hook-associated protein 2
MEVRIMADLSMDGLSSGMDTKSLVNQIVSSEFGPKLQNLQTEKSELTQAKDTWRDVRSRINSFGDTINELKYSSTFNSNQVTSSDESVATATANSDATANSYDLNVTQMAQAHRVVSDQQDGSDTSIGLVGDKDGDSTDTNTFSIDVGGTTVKIGDENTIDGTSSLNDLVNYINNDSDNDDGGDKLIQASVVDNKLVLESAQTGTANSLSISSDPDGILDELGFANADFSGSTVQSSQDSKFDINGVQVTRSSNEGIDDVVDNVTFDLAGEGETTIEVSPDLEKATTAVQDFVDQYNSSTGFISDKLEDSSSLQGDGTLMRLESNLRQEVTGSVDSTSDYDQLAMIGIEVDKNGTMTLNETELKQALEDDPEGVKKLFNADSTDGDSFDGVATRLDGYVDALASSTGTIPDTVDYYGDRIDSIEDEMETTQRRVEMRKESLQEEFTNMETYMSEMQNQFSWMQSQLSSMGGTTQLLNSM